MQEGGTDVLGARNVAEFDGEVDYGSSGRFESKLSDLYARCEPYSHIVIDLSKIEYFDDSGVKVLDRLLKRAIPDGKTIVLVIPADHVIRKIFNLTNLGEYLQILRTPAEASPYIVRN